jgi:beta-lactamase class A
MATPPPAPVVMNPGVAFGHLTIRVGRATTGLDAVVDGRLARRLRLPGRPRAATVPLAPGRHEVRLRAAGPGGARWTATRVIWALPRSARRAGSIGGHVDRGLQREVERLVDGLPAIGGVYVQHLVSGCGAGVNAGAQFPAASTLKAAILLDVERRWHGRVPPALASLLDQMILDSSDRAANRVLEIVGGGSGELGAARVTETLVALGLSRSLVRRPYIIEDAREGIPVSTRAQPALATNFVTTPFELARLMTAIHRGALGRGALPGIGVPPRVIRTEVLPRLLAVHDRTKLVAGLPPGVLAAHKTGYTKQVKHDGGIVYLRSGPVVVAAMSWSRSGVGDAVGDRFIARLAAVATARLGRGGRCGARSR